MSADLRKSRLGKRWSLIHRHVLRIPVRCRNCGHLFFVKRRVFGGPNFSQERIPAGVGASKPKLDDVVT